MRLLLALFVGCHSGSAALDPVVGETAVGDTSPGDSVEQIPGTEGGASEAGESVFVDDVVHAYALALDDDAYAALLAAPTTYAAATFSDGESWLEVGVRLKGYSSFQPLTGKPNFRISFDHYVDEQRYNGLEAVDLISEAEDPAAMSEAIAYRVFRAAGQPASRTGFASLTLGGAAYGLYTLVEKKDDVLLARWWPDDDDGSLYESSSEFWPCDLDDGGTPRCDCWEQDEVGSADTRADLEALCAAATDTPDTEWFTTISAAMDWSEVSRHIAMEIVLDAHDHYAGYMGNVYLYHSPDADQWALMPASMNSLFGSSRYVAGSCGSADHTLADFSGGLLARRCWADAACSAELYESLRWAVDALEASDVLAQIDAWEPMLAPYVAADTRLGYSPEQYELQVRCIRGWLAARPAELAPVLPAGCLGKGGDLDIERWGDLSTNGSCDRAWPDAVAYRVATVDGDRVELGLPPDGIAAGDEVLLVLAQGAPGDHAAVGTYAFAEVASVEAGALVLTAPPSVPFPTDLSAWTLVVQRVPHYGDVVVRAGATLTAGAWNGETGGVLAMRVGTLTVEEGGAVSASGLGYAGGAMGTSYNVDGYQGESLDGEGTGGASSVEGYNEANGAWGPNLGGGGCNVGGGGGEHAGGATASTSWNEVATAPAAGEMYGEADLSALLFGSGGGGVVDLGGSSGPGGAGGGVLYIEAGTLVAGVDAIVARGEDTVSWAAGSWSYGAGGGAGGSVWIVADTLTLATGAVVATGGAGYAAVTRPGGNGGAGRIRVDCGTVNGEVCTEGALSGTSEPAAFVGAR